MWPRRCRNAGSKSHRAAIMRLERTGGGILADHHRRRATRGFDLVMYRHRPACPTPKGLGLEALGVQIGRQGQIVVDDYSQTAVPSIFAVGDVTDRINLTPVAIREGHAFADTVFRGMTHRPTTSLSPRPCSPSRSSAPSA